MSLSQGVQFAFASNLRAQRLSKAITVRRVSKSRSVQTPQASATSLAEQRDESAGSSGSSLKTFPQLSGILAAAKGLDATFQVGGQVCPDERVKLSWRRPGPKAGSVRRLSLPGKNSSKIMGPQEYSSSSKVLL